MTSSIFRGLQITPALGLFGVVGLREPTMQPVHAKDMALTIAEALLNERLVRQTNAVVGPEEFPLSEAVLRVSKVLKKKVIIFNVPVPIMFALAWVMERVMNNSLVTVSQIRMLADGLSENSARVAEDEQPLPDDMKPKTYFTEQQIREVLEQMG